MEGYDGSAWVLSRKFSLVSDRSLLFSLIGDSWSEELLAALLWEASRHLFLGVELFCGWAMAEPSSFLGINTICSNCLDCNLERDVSNWCSPLEELSSRVASVRTLLNVLETPSALFSWVTLSSSGREKLNSSELSELEPNVWSFSWSSLPWWAVTWTEDLRNFADKLNWSLYWPHLRRSEQFRRRYPELLSPGSIWLRSSSLSLEETSVDPPVFQYSNISVVISNQRYLKLQSSSKIHYISVEKLQYYNLSIIDYNYYDLKSSPVLKR